jgi:hypothetical protein
MAPMVERHPLARDHAEYSKLLLALRQMQGAAALKTELFNKLEAAGLLALEDPAETKAAQVALGTSEAARVR